MNEILTVRAGNQLRLVHSHPEDVTTGKFNELFTRSEKGTGHKTVFIANTDALVTAARNGAGDIVNILHARTARADAGEPRFWGYHDPHEKPFGFYRFALKHKLDMPANVQARHSLEWAIVYTDETLVPAYSTMGTWGWLLREEDKAAIQQLVPPLKRGRHIMNVWCWMWGQVYFNQHEWQWKRYDGKVDYTATDAQPDWFASASKTDRATKATFKVTLDMDTGDILGIVDGDGKEVEWMGLTFEAARGNVLYATRVEERFSALRMKAVREAIAA